MKTLLKHLKTIKDLFRCCGCCKFTSSNTFQYLGHEDLKIDKDFSVIATNQIPHFRNEMETGPLTFARKYRTALETGIPEVFAKGNSAQFPTVSNGECKTEFNREERSLRYVAMVETFLDDNKPKCHLKIRLALFQTS